MNLKICILIYTTMIILCVINAVILYTRIKKTNTLYSLIALQTVVILWLIFGMIENTAQSIAEMSVLVRLTFLPINFIGGFWLLFWLFYTQNDKVNKKTIVLIFTPLVLCSIPLLPINMFSLIMTKKTLDPADNHWGIVFYINYAITISYFLIGLFCFLKDVKKFTKGYKIKHYILLSLSFFIPVLTNALAGTKIVSAPKFDIMPVSLALTSLLLTVAIFRMELLNISVIANNNVFYYLDKSILVIDRENNIIDYNKSAIIDFFGICDFKRTKKVDLFLSSLSKYMDNKEIINKTLEYLDNYHEANYKTYLCLRISHQNIKHITVDIQPLKNKRGIYIGKIITMNDILSFNNLPIEYERNQFSQILHDSISPSFLRIIQNIQLAQKYYSKSEDIQQYLNNSLDQANATSEMVRNIIHKLKPVNFKEYGLKGALLSLFNKVKVYGIKIDPLIDISDIIDKMICTSEAAQVIYSICEQAIDNTYYHCNNQNKEINISIVFKESTLYLSIFDNGKGCGKMIKGRGLIGMEEKVSSLNGKISFRNPSDGGFTINAVIPMEVYANE